jgi:hypothetical protein
MSDYIEHACFYCGSLICREYCQEEKMMPEPPIDPPEDTTEAPYDVYLTVLVRVHAPNEAGARDEAILCMREGEVVDSCVEPCDEGCEEPCNDLRDE